MIQNCIDQQTTVQRLLGSLEGYYPPEELTGLATLLSNNFLGNLVEEGKIQHLAQVLGMSVYSAEQCIQDTYGVCVEVAVKRF